MGKFLREIVPLPQADKELGNPARTAFYRKFTPGQNTKVKVNYSSPVGTQNFSNNLSPDNRVE
jgi:hypothetical protein